METIQEEFLHEEGKWRDYRIQKEEGNLEGVLVGRRRSEKGHLLCYFDLFDGRKIQAVAWENKNYFGLDKAPLGSEVLLGFRKARGGNLYLTRVSIAED